MELEKLSFNHFFNCIVEFVICLICRDFRIFGFDGICALEQESCLACLDHAEVVVAVTAGDGVISDRLQSFDGCLFGFFAAHLEIGDFTVICDNKGIAEDCRIAEFLHQRTCKLREGITDDDYLC